MKSKKRVIRITQSEILKRECDEITARTGFYIPPYRLAFLMKTAQKIADLLIKSDICISYREAVVVLKIVMGAVKDVTGLEDDD